MTDILPYVLPIVLSALITKIDNVYHISLVTLMFISLGCIYYLYFWYFSQLENSILITAYETHDAGYTAMCRVPDDYKAITFQLLKRNINIFKLIHADIDRNLQFSIDDIMDEQYKDCKKYNSFCVLYCKKLLCPTNDIYIRTFTNEVTLASSKKTQHRKNYNYVIFSNKLTTRELFQIIDEWKSEYYNYSRQMSQKIKQSCFMLITNEKNNQIWVQEKFSSYMTFDHLIFDQKEELLLKLNRFLNNRQYYIDNARPYMFGLLLYGEPGCGKTSTIKAIANYTKRHVVQIDLSKIKTCQELINVFYSKKINDYHIPVDKKIIVFEDIDCMIDIVLEREKEKNDEEHKGNDDEEQKKAKNEDEQEMEIDIDKIRKETHINNGNLLDNIFKSVMKKSKDNKLNLSCILNIIDGIIEQPGRILIITTNYPDRLDKALVRRGRVDMKLKYEKVTSNSIRNFMSRKFDDEIPDEIISNIENKLTPLELEDLIDSANSIEEFRELFELQDKTGKKKLIF